jgi:hypothetical protein
MKKLLAKVAVLSSIGTGLVTLSTLSASAAASDNFPPQSPGVCNMLHTSPQGYAGMMEASAQGLGNMVTLVVANCG